MKLTISIVTFNNETVIRETLASIKKSTIKRKERCDVLVVDNSSTDRTVDIISHEFPDITIIPSENIGFGAGHNKAIRKILGKSDFHLIMNPDVYFGEEVLAKLVAFMDINPDVGMVMPKIYYPENRLQYLCKLLPTPFDLIGRRFMPGFLKLLFKRRLDSYEFKDRDYNQQIEAPHLSGCFTMVRTKIFEEVGLFDERFFMYLEDVDLSRRIHSQYKTLYYPDIFIYHRYHRNSYKRFNHLKYHISSAVKYFNKWGWFFDKERKKINRNAKEKDQVKEKNIELGNKM